MQTGLGRRDTERGGDMVWCREAVVVKLHGQSHIHAWWIKIRRDTVEASDPRPDCTAQGSSTRKINLCDFWL